MKFEMITVNNQDLIDVSKYRPQENGTAASDSRAGFQFLSAIHLVHKSIPPSKTSWMFSSIESRKPIRFPQLLQ